LKENNHSNTQYIQEDEIDLRELFRTIMDSKKLIILITSVITILAVIYAYTTTPLYEAKALVEIGNYKVNNNNNNNNSTNIKILLNKPTQLSKRLNVIFIDIHKNDKDKKSEVISILVPKESKEFLEIKALAISNELAIKEINLVLSHIQEKDKTILLDVKNRRELKINNINSQISNIQEKQVELFDKNIKLQVEQLVKFKEQLNDIKQNIKWIQKKQPVLAALQLMGQSDLTRSILTLEMHIIELQNKKEKLTTMKINSLIEKRNLLQSMLLPHNYKTSKIVGKIITNDYSIKPKKKLIVIVAFITGLILSIFLVFFLSFLRNDEKI
jgi:LPS O-antigen subunit length determinant protein (WzzB/FepE family)